MNLVTSCSARRVSQAIPNPTSIQPMQKSQTSAPKGGFNLQDILFVMFKHKWKIILLSLLGFGGATAMYLNRTPIYRSRAKLLVRYVRETGKADQYEEMRSPGGGGKAGDPVINTEIEIFKSLDLAQEVAESVGIERLLPGAEIQGDAGLAQAAGAVLKGLEVITGQSTTVLYVTYVNKDQSLAQTVLKELLKCYFVKHTQLHLNSLPLDEVEKQCEEARERLKQTGEQLNKLRTDTGILSLTDATAVLSSQRARTEDEVFKAKADFAELQANIDAHGKVPGAADEVSAEDFPGNGNIPKAKVAPKEPGTPPPAQAITEYRAVMDLLAFLQKRDLELRIKFKAGNRLLVLNQQQLDTYETKRRALIAKYPDLAADTVVLEKAATGDGSKWSVINEKARLAALSAKIEVYEAHLKEIAEQFGKQYAIGVEIDELDHRKQMEDTEYRSMSVKLKEARMRVHLDPSSIPNITVVQQPSNPVKDFDDLTKKIILGLAGSGIGLGLGLAFLIELVLVRKVNRPIEIQTRLQLPLLMSIPYIRKKERGGLLLGMQQGPPRLGTGEELTAHNGNASEVEFETPTRRANHFILPYSETIRDRIIFNFEVNNVIHKPKLVAVTGLSEGAGASTIAAGLAKSFSEIPGMKVLMVDLSSFHPEDNPLFGEVPRHSLNGALHLARNSQFRENPQNLYYARATARRDDESLTTFTPVQLNEIMPHLQASEYDYIIFDMPTIDQTSRTLTMAGMMDKVLLVLDAENTSRDGLLWGYSELVKGKADVSCVFNKTRTVVPGWLIGQS